MKVIHETLRVERNVISTFALILFGGKHVTFVLFAFECVPHMDLSQQIKYLRVYLTRVVHSKLSIYVCT